MRKYYYELFWIDFKYLKEITEKIYSLSLDEIDIHKLKKFDSKKFAELDKLKKEISESVRS